MAVMMKKVNVIKEKGATPAWEDKVTLNIDTKQFPDMKDQAAEGKIKMVIEGDITSFRKDKEKEDYTIEVKEAAIIKNESQQIKEKMPEQKAEMPEE